MPLSDRPGLTFLLLLTIAQSASAGPNWQAIEEARSAKQEEKQITITRINEHEVALQKLKAACEKVKDHIELADACRDIIAADAEINTGK